MDKNIDERILNLINEHHVLTLATAAGNKPYCCNCYYVYDEAANIFVVKINENTRHGREINQNSSVAASIFLETDELGKIQGLQITAKAVYYTAKELDYVKGIYLKKYPYALAVKGDYLTLEPDFYKLTDNRFGIGKKLTWNRINKI
ncbi:MAG: pyridoxamine 5'-phosphate oxidase family protein [Bacteroidales bacterium]|nr:pyridoxamine 5'-phosphate oxidase family protein [Bacteroidales bacterium]MBQ5540402.1 pyridoxamine 5'-phosphate oxidase family protein [Bacteroidales bacterium]MBR4679441.1 pyridoxamine 5'-phosphate oxidase family protein [Bacteroidales bacterium]